MPNFSNLGLLSPVAIPTKINTQWYGNELNYVQANPTTTIGNIGGTPYGNNFLMVAIEAIAYHQKDSLGGFSDIAGTNWRLLTSTDQIRNSGSAIYDASTVQSIRLAQTNDPTGLTRATLDEAAYYNQVTHEVVIVNLGANQAPEFVAGLATLVTPSFTASEQTKYMIGGDAFPLAVREAVAA